MSSSTNGGGVQPAWMQAESIPPDVDIKAGRTRASAALKDRYASHLHEMFLDGRMTEEEYNARRAHIDKIGVTETMLMQLTADLAPLMLPEAPKPVTERMAAVARFLHWKSVSKPWRIIIYLAIIMIGCMIWIGTIAALASAHKHLHPLVSAVGLCVIVFGAAITIGTIIFWFRDDKVGYDA